MHCCCQHPNNLHIYIQWNGFFWHHIDWHTNVHVSHTVYGCYNHKGQITWWLYNYVTVCPNQSAVISPHESQWIARCVIILQIDIRTWLYIQAVASCIEWSRTSYTKFYSVHDPHMTFKTPFFMHALINLATQNQKEHAGYIYMYFKVKNVTCFDLHKSQEEVYYTASYICISQWCASLLLYVIIAQNIHVWWWIIANYNILPL